MILEAVMLHFTYVLIDIDLPDEMFRKIMTEKLVISQKEMPTLVWKSFLSEV